METYIFGNPHNLEQKQEVINTNYRLSVVSSSDFIEDLYTSCIRMSV